MTDEPKQYCTICNERPADAPCETHDADICSHCTCPDCDAMYDEE